MLSTGKYTFLLLAFKRNISGKPTADCVNSKSPSASSTTESTTYHPLTPGASSDNVVESAPSMVPLIVHVLFPPQFHNIVATTALIAINKYFFIPLYIKQDDFLGSNH